MLRRLLLGALCLAALPLQAESLDDPMRPPQAGGMGKGGMSAAVSSERTPLVSSIIVAPGRRSAVIAGRSVGVGGHVNGMEVVAIDPTGVTVRREGKLQRLPFHSVTVKTPAQVSQP